jgi:hypothetical protein
MMNKGYPMIRTVFVFLPLLTASFVYAEETNDLHYIQFFNQTVSRILPGYRYPGDADLKLAWKMKGSFVYKTEDDAKKTKAPWWTKGLFNDDDIEDYAYILINLKNNKKYLYAFISTEKGYVPVLLKDAHDGELGLATQMSTKIQTASGKGYWKPAKDDPPEITVKRQAIAFFEFEGASSIFLWDGKASKFKRHWISD